MPRKLRVQHGSAVPKAPHRSEGGACKSHIERSGIPPQRRQIKRTDQKIGPFYLVEAAGIEHLRDILVMRHGFLLRQNVFLTVFMLPFFPFILLSTSLYSCAGIRQNSRQPKSRSHREQRLSVPLRQGPLGIFSLHFAHNYAMIKEAPPCHRSDPSPT